MNIFNCKRIAERKTIADLERRLAEAEKDRDKYMKNAADLRARFEKMGELEEVIPEGCIRGPWCKSCDFVKTFYFADGWSYTTAYVCGKGKSCSNFTQSLVKNEV